MWAALLGGLARGGAALGGRAAMFAEGAAARGAAAEGAAATESKLAKTVNNVSSFAPQQQQQQQKQVPTFTEQSGDQAISRVAQFEVGRN